MYSVQVCLWQSMFIVLAWILDRCPSTLKILCLTTLLSNCTSFPILKHVISAVLITGGYGAQQSAEIYHPDRDFACVLPDIPYRRQDHTQDGSLMCGGSPTFRSCRRWNPDTGAWDLVTESLTEDRRCHISWTPADGSGTYLMGGWSDKTSEVIDKDNGVTSSFPLQHRTD